MQATEVPQPSNQTSDHDATQPARVLVVDDQVEVAQFLCEMLNMVGYDAIAESNPQVALQRVEDEMFDAIISDFKMPEMTGSEFFEAATAIRPGLVTRFIFLTGDLYNMQTEATLAALGVPLLGKPFRLATVEQVVGDVIAKNSLRS